VCERVVPLKETGVTGGVGSSGAPPVVAVIQVVVIIFEREKTMQHLPYNNKIITSDHVSCICKSNTVYKGI